MFGSKKQTNHTPFRVLGKTLVKNFGILTKNFKIDVLEPEIHYKEGKTISIP